MNIKSLLIISIIIFYLILACEYDTPQNIYPRQGAADPVIESVSPESADNGIVEFKISGQNFSTDVNQNFVYFGTAEGNVIKAAENELTVLRPLMISGTHDIQIAVQQAFHTTKFGPFSLEPGLKTFEGIFDVNSFTVDSDENVYIEIEDIVYKITFDGTQTEYGAVDNTCSAMRMGPGGYLYIQRRDNKNLYRIAPGGGVAEEFAKIKQKASCFDFAEDGTIFSGGDKYGMFSTTADGIESKGVGPYEKTFAINAIRVFEGYVYIAADTITEDASIRNSGIWKHQMLDNGEIGEPVLVFDWDDFEPNPESFITDITFSEEGELYVGTNRSNPVLIIHDDGSVEDLYAGILESPASQICWGNKNYLYINRMGKDETDSGLSRIIMGKAGATYFGRGN